MTVNLNDYSFDAMTPENNLFMFFMWDMLNSSKDPAEFLFRLIGWDHMHPMISTVKLMIAPVLGYYVYWRGHPTVFKDEFYEGENDGRDTWLLYERRGS